MKQRDQGKLSLHSADGGGLKHRSMSNREFSSSTNGRRNTSTRVSSAIHQLTRSTHGIRNSSSGTNLMTTIAHSAPGRKATRSRVVSFNSEVSQSARRLGGRHMSLATPLASYQTFEQSTIARSGYECAACEAGLVIEQKNQGKLIEDDENSGSAALFHLDVIPNPTGDINSGDDTNGPTLGAGQFVYVREQVWENQYYSYSDGKWGREFVDLVGMSPYTSKTLEPIHELQEPHGLDETTFWVDEWAPDTLEPGCDSEGWLYSVSFNGLNHPQPQSLHDEDLTKKARRRRLIRHRKIENTDKGWLDELKNRSMQNSMLKSPLCHSCDQKLKRRLQEELEKLQQDELVYDNYLLPKCDDNEMANVKSKPKSRSVKLSHISWQDEAEDEAPIDLDEMTLEELEREEQALVELLQEMDQTSQTLSRNRQLIWECASDLQVVQQDTFGEAAFIHLVHQFTKEERASVGVFSVHASDMLRCLQRYNVFNDAFHIWHDGSFGTINGLRLGRLPSKPVEWTEINAALGQATLLLTTVAQRVNLNFQRIVPVARGSFSKIYIMQDGEKKKEYPLFSDGGFLQRQKFNMALGYLLECVDEAGQMAKKEDAKTGFPYKIFKGKIGELNIAVGGNDEQWTRALKYLLTHLKWLLAWAAKRYKAPNAV
ncbi:hypothetical protein Ae201684P_012805 [Aphanomyces euteiches]|nr:hypothetical protein Ae201684P_012805 [Aphanomyces euteiches]